MRLHGVVILLRRLVARLDAQRRCRQPGFDVAVHHVSRHAETHGFRREALKVEAGARGLDLIARRKQRGAFGRRFQRLRDDQRDRLVGVTDAVVLERLEAKPEEADLRVRVLHQRWPVSGRDHLHDTGMRLGGLDIEMRDATARDRADGMNRVEHPSGWLSAA